MFGIAGDDRALALGAKLYTYSQDAIFVLDPPADRIVEANPQAGDLLGFSHDELLDTPISVVHPDEMDRLLSFTDEVFQEGHGWTDSLSCLRSDGCRVRAEISATCIEIDGKPLIVAMVRESEARLRALEELERSERRFRRLVETAADGIYVADPTGRIEDVNERGAEILGYDREELLGLRVSEFSTTTHDEVQQILAQASDGPLTVESHHIRKDGSRFPVEVRVGLLEEDDRTRLVGLSRDVSERHAGEAALRESEERFRMLFETAADAILLIDEAGTFVHVNQRASEALGYTVEELVGMSVWDISVGMPRTDVLACVAEAREGPLTLGGVHQRKDGTEFPVELRIGYCDWGGRPHVVTICRDVTARNEAESEVRASRARLECILDSAMDAVVVTDSDLNVNLFNRAAVSTFQTPAKAVVGRSLRPLLTPRFVELLEEYVDLCRIGGEATQGIWAPSGMAAVRAEGEEFPVEVSVSHASTDEESLYTIILRDVGERCESEERLRNLEREASYLRREVSDRPEFREMVGRSRSLLEIFDVLERIAPTSSTVLITGETGTGKEVVARTIHRESARSDQILVNVNCAALPESLIESELFGHERGAFTGADKRRIGRFELADGGTILLDEIGELSLPIQAKLLRVLQDGEFERVGGTETIRVDTRIIASTNRDLRGAIREQRFRPDLFYRLNVLPIALPPLRERRADIPLLAQHFVEKFSKKVGRDVLEIPTSVMDQLVGYDWPGNIRELENVIERGVVLSRTSRLELGSWLSPPADEQAPRFSATLDDVQREHIVRTLDSTDWVVSGERGAARILGLKPTTLESRMKRLGIDRPDRSG